MTPREALIALNMLPKIGPVRVNRLLERFGSAREGRFAPPYNTCFSAIIRSRCQPGFI